jgi:hypothetical protein
MDSRDRYWAEARRYLQLAEAATERAAARKQGTDEAAVVAQIAIADAIAALAAAAMGMSATDKG